MVQAPDKAILDNLDFEIATWRERQIEVFNELSFPEIKGDDKRFFEAIGWLNFAMDFTETVFPHTSPKTVITDFTKPYAIPLWIAGKAQEKFSSYYRKLRDDAQQRLNATLRSVRDEFTNAIVDQARGFKATTHARNLASGILHYLRGRQFQDDAQMDAYIRRLVHNGRLVETRLEELRRRTQPGFRRLMDKISHVWQTTYHVSRWHRLHLWIRGSRSERYTSVNWNNTKKESEDWLLSVCWAYDVERVGDRVLVTARGTDTNHPSMIYSVTSHQSIIPNLADALHRGESVMCLGEGISGAVDSSQQGMQRCLDGVK